MAESRAAVPAVRSLRVRLLLLVGLFVVLATVLLALHTLRSFEEAATVSSEHEGRLLSDLLEAGIAPYLADRDHAGMQAHIDRIVATRARNDIEMNVILLDDNGSTIVASNVPGNLEEADEEEHIALLAAHELRRPVVIVGVADAEPDPDDEPVDASHPDFYLAPGRRFLEITTPLAVAGEAVGAITIKTSLAGLDEELEASRHLVLVAAAVEMLAVMLGLGFLLDLQLFRPLRALTGGMQRVAAGDLDRSLVCRDPRDEIGVITTAFNSMAGQLARARRQLHQYLNPRAIEEAYRRAGTPGAEPRAEEREVSVLFADIVAFTTLAEGRGPGGAVALLNRFHDTVNLALIDTGGYVDKFVADEAVCVFEGSSHAADAVAAAAQVIALLRDAAVADPITARLGINSGPCIVADIGSRQFGRLDRTVIGDTVNVAQRLMAAAQPGTALISAATYAALPAPGAEIVPVGELLLKGKRHGVVAYRFGESPGEGVTTAEEG